MPLRPTKSKSKSKEDEVINVADCSVLMPEMDPESYAKHTGQRIGVVRGHIDTGVIPTVKRGRRVLVNTAKIQQENLKR